ncbi:MAG: twin-arginine translocase subunit TatC [Vicinamibacteria bacterium]
MPRLGTLPAQPPAVDDEEDVFDHRTVLARLEELRKRIVISLATLLIAFFVCFTFSARLYEFLIIPVRAALPPDANLIATRVPEIFMLHLRMALFASLFVSAPMWLYQLWRLLRAVHPLRRSFLPLVFFAILLFAAGAAFGHYVLFPYAVRFLTTVGSETIHVMLSIEKLFSFYSYFILGLGAAFQIPTAVLVLSKLELVTPRLLVRQLRLVILVIFALAAVLTPTPDLVTQCLLALPMLGLYVFSIGLCWLVTRGNSKPR